MSNAKIISIIDHETTREALARQHDIELAMRTIEREFVSVRVAIDELKQRLEKLEKGSPASV